MSYYIGHNASKKQLCEISKTDKIGELKHLAKHLDVKGYSKYALSGIEELRKLVIEKIPCPERVKSPPQTAESKSPLRTVPISESDLGRMTVVKLKEHAKSMGIKVHSSWTKLLIIHSILINQKESNGAEDGGKESSIIINCAESSPKTAQNITSYAVPSSAISPEQQSDLDAVQELNSLGIQMVLFDDEKDKIPYLHIVGFLLDEWKGFKVMSLKGKTVISQIIIFKF